MLRGLKVVAGCVLVLMLVVAACGETDDATSPAGGGGGTAVTPTVGPEETPTPESNETPDPSSIDLDGTSWVLSGFGARDLDSDVEVTLAFADGQASGNAGCNDYGAEYEITGDGTISIRDTYATEMACEQGMEIESEYLEAFANVERYRAVEGRLELMDAAGETLLVFGSGEPSSASFDGTNWHVVTVDGERPVPGTTPMLSFADGYVSGTAACNGFGGEYTAGDDGTFSVPLIESTAMACEEPDGIMEFESALVQALTDVESYRGDEDEIELVDAAGDVRFVLQNENDAGDVISVEGTTWVLTRIEGATIGQWPPTTLIFSVNGPTGTSGCLTYNLWSEDWQGGEIHDGQLRTSDRLCGEMGLRGAGEQYFDTLATVTTYEAREQRLQMMDDTGSVVLTFRRGLDGGELEGTTWDLLSIQGEPLVEGTSIVLSFEGSMLTGDGGCNGYGGPFMVVDPGIVSIMDVIRTEMGCVEPEGVMEQETAYFDTLPRATSYAISDLGLALFDAHGKTLLVFERASDDAGLDGTAWSLVTLNGHPVVEGSDPSLSFNGGRISGWSGCNGLELRDVTVEGGSISIGHVIRTEEGCPSPELTRQERGYFDALVGVATYSLTADRLEMMDSAGEVVLAYERR